MSRPLRVLLIEDDPFDRRSVGRLLRAAPPAVWRFELLEVGCLEEGRVALRERHPDLVLLDHRLPDGEGLTLLQELPELLDPPPAVIVLTGSEDEQLASSCLQAGAQDYLVKGAYEQDGLLRSIRHSLERARLARVLREQARELERSNRELERFASVASHDLREPLRTVRLLGQRLHARCGPALDSRGQEYLQRIVQASERMEQMVRQLLTLSRVGQSPGQRRPVPLDQLLESVRADLVSILEQSDAQLEIEPLPPVLGDETQLRRLFMNLIGNALKFRHPERAPRVTVRAWPVAPGAERVTVAVEDNGIGFPPRLARELFLPFRRLHAGYPGSGMGLAICQAVVELHGGEISATGVPEQGATFAVTLPTSGARQPPANQVREGSARA